MTVGDQLTVVGKELGKTVLVLHELHTLHDVVDGLVHVVPPAVSGPVLDTRQVNQGRHLLVQQGPGRVDVSQLELVQQKLLQTLAGSRLPPLMVRSSSQLFVYTG